MLTKKGKIKLSMLVKTLVFQLMLISCSAHRLSNFSIPSSLRFPASIENEELILRELADDIIFEIDHIDSSTESILKKEKFKKEFSRFLNHESNYNPTHEPGKTWSNLWPPQELKLPDTVARNKDNLKLIELESRGEILKHSISQLDLYVSNRLGPAVFKMLQSNRLNVDVFGGDVEDFLSTVEKQSRAVKVPSLYESWGIHKILVTDKFGRSRLCFVVPPIREYINQYGYLLQAAGKKKLNLTLDLNANKKMISSFENSYDNLIKQLGGEKPTHVFIGYANHLEKVINLHDNKGTIKKLKKEDFLAGVWLESFDESGKRMTILGLTSEKTIWGEASAALASAVVKHHPKSLYFMGSAGAINPKVPVYSISIPDQFEIRNNIVPIQNAFLERFSKDNLPEDGSVIIKSRHGNSNGPAEQSIEYIDKLLTEKIDTIDVEQSLVAKVVSDYNAKTTNSPIIFGAANIITDHPASTKFPSQAHFNLDDVNISLKNQRRLEILDLMFKTAQKKSSNTSSKPCFELIKEFFQLE